jgi:CHAT domain-containing protein
VKKFILIISFLTSIVSVSQNIKEAYNIIDEGNYKQAIETFKAVAVKNIQKSPSVYIQAKFGLAESYLDLGVMHLSIKTLKDLKGFILKKKPNRYLELARIHLMLADNYDLLFDQIEVLKNINKFYSYYKLNDHYQSSYEAAYNAYMGRYYNISFDINQAYTYTSKALKHINSANYEKDTNIKFPIIETYQVYASHCFTLRNYNEVDQIVKYRYFDTLRDLVTKRFNHDNIKKAKTLINTSAMMLDKVFNYYSNSRSKEELQNPQRLYNQLISNYEKGISIYQNILGDKSDYMPRYYTLQAWLAYGKNDIPFGLDLVDSAIQGYGMEDYIKTGIIPNYTRVLSSLRMKIFLKESQYQRTKDTTLLYQNLEDLYLTEKLWKNYQEDQINEKQDFLTNSYNQQPYQYLYKNFIELHEVSQDDLYLEKIHEYDEKSKYNSLVFSLKNTKFKDSLYQFKNKLYLLMDELFLSRIFYKNNQKPLEKKINKKLDYLAESNHQIQNNSIPSIKDIQKKMKNNEAQISYNHLGIGVNKIYAKLITKNKAQIIEIDSLRNLRKYKFKVNYLKEALKKNDIETFKYRSYELYCLLFEKISKELPEGIDKIEIIPFAHIETLPFDLLLYYESDTKDYRKLPYLVNKFTFKYAFSETIKELTLQTINENNKKIDFFKPEFKNNGQNDLKLGNEYAKKISSNSDGKLYSNEKATISNFTQSLSNASHITLISHASSDEEILNQNKGLYFQDGFLSLDSIYKLSSNADLLILTGCETGDGYKDVGEGNVSLARAFTSAGVKSLMVSSWEIDELSTMRILNSFFEKYDGKTGSSLSLRDAKLDYINSSIPRKASPIYWAGLNIVGTESFLENDSLEWNTYLFLLGGFIVLLIILFLIKKRVKNT